MKYIAHIDLNAFFAQVEMNRHPEFKGKPLVVGNDLNHGVVATSNYEARKYGITSGLATSEAVRLYPSLIVVPGDYEEYQKQSHLFFKEVQKVFPLIEMASIDECYAECTQALEGMDEQRIHDFLFDFQMNLLKKTNLKCSIGLAHNKFLAKMGSDYKKPLGLTILLNHQALVDIIWPLPIKAMYGIGKKTYPQLEELGIQTIGDLAHVDEKKIQKVLGVYSEWLIYEANGGGDDVVSPLVDNPKSCSSDYTFRFDTNDYDELRSRLIQCVEDVAENLCRHNKVSKTICLKIRDSNFITKSKRYTLQNYENDKKILAFWALKLFDDFYHGELLRLIGFSTENCVEYTHIKSPQKQEKQMTLFDISKRRRN